MTYVQFAQVCDLCGKRGPEYYHGYICLQCQADTCGACMVPGSQCDETGRCICIACDEANRREGEQFTASTPTQMLNATIILLAVGIVLYVIWAIKNGVHP